MALKEFWNSVRAGYQLGLPPRVISDSPRIDSGFIGQVLAKADLWLTPSVVRGFNAEDFNFLPLAEREKLSKQVEDFRSIAAKRNPRGPASAEQRAAALPIFEQIVGFLEFDRFGDAAAFRIGKMVEADPAYPGDKIVDIRYRTRLNSNGKPSIEIMVYLPESEIDVFLEHSRDIDQTITEIVFSIGEPYWPYLSFRLENELAELQVAGVEE